MKKLTALLLLFIVSLNIALAPANAVPKVSEFQELFDDVMYICYEENSYNLAISDYEKLLHYSYDNNQHQKFAIKAFALPVADIFEFNYLKSNSIILLNISRESFAELNLVSNKTSRAPPISFI